MTKDESLQRPLRWGIVGTGTISRQMAADLQLLEDAVVVAVSSRTLKSAEEFGRDFGTPSRYASYQDMLTMADLDVVYIGTPHITHFEIAAAAIAAGKHVLCEKPMGLNAAEVRALGLKAHTAGVFLMEAMWMKFNPLYVKLIERIDEGAIGEVRSARASFGIPFPRDDSSRWKRGGSTLLDQGIYVVTLAEMLFGAPRHIAAGGTLGEHSGDIREHYTFIYTGDRHFQGASSQVEFIDLTAAISGTAGWITTDPVFWATNRFTIFLPNNGHLHTEVVETEREGHGFVPMLRAVTTAIRNGDIEHPVHTNDNAANAYDTMDEIRRQVEGL